LVSDNPLYHWPVPPSPPQAGLSGITRKLTRLFHPRRHKWSHHFRYDGALLVGRTAIGRTTIRVLHINCDEAMTLRDSLIAEGLF
jgi:hypothetical protein